MSHEFPPVVKKREDQMTRWMRLVILALTVGGLVALLAYGFTHDERYMRNPVTAEQGPSLALTLFDGKVIRLEDFRAPLSLFLRQALSSAEASARHGMHHEAQKLTSTVLPRC